jgi:hypothetical protein
MPVVRHQLADPAGTPFVVLAEAERRHRETISRFVRRHSWHFLALPTVCLVNGAPVPVKEWAHRKLHKRDDVVFLSRPGRGGMGRGGGSTTKSIIAVVGLIALTAIAPWAAGLVFGAGTTAAGIGAALLVAGGSLLLTRFMQPKAGGQSEQKDDLYSISSGSNQARPLQPIPVGYGRRLATPDLARRPTANIRATTNISISSSRSAAASTTSRKSASTIRRCGPRRAGSIRPSRMCSCNIAIPAIRSPSSP